METALENHEETVSIGGRVITKFRFADNIDGFAGLEEELRNLLECIHNTCEAAGMVISGKKPKGGDKKGRIFQRNRSPRHQTG